MTRRAQRLIDEFRPLGVSRPLSELVYFCRATAYALLDRCEAQGLPLLGIDGAFITDASHCETIDWILDLSSDPYAYRSARDYLDRARNRPLFFTFTIGE